MYGIHRLQCSAECSSAFILANFTGRQIATLEEKGCNWHHPEYVKDTIPNAIYHVDMLQQSHS